jgi:cell fate regulator YaaT (PSP1 superfamily)
MDKVIKIAGVRFQENWKVYDFDAMDLDLVVGDKVIVDSDRGLGFAQVVRLKKMPLPLDAEKTDGEEQELPVKGQEGQKPEEAPPSTESGQAAKGLRRILRKATEEDLTKQEKNRAKESDAFTIAQDMITERELPMKLIRVEYSFDGSRATFFFFSETRVDFRELVKDLAYKFKSRIEMRQIGVRDVARMIGGFGPCGRELCCSSFLKNFEPVSIRMAKKQEMVLNPAKISGVCGRLLCCLSYEYEMYDEIKKDQAGLRDTAIKEKKEEDERRITEERRESEERRIAEEKKRQEERRQQQEQRQGKQKETGQKRAGRSDRRKGQQQERKDQPQERKDQVQDRQQPPAPEKLQQPEQKAAQPQEGEKAGKKKRRRFWRRKKKGSQQGENKPQGTEGPAE